MDGMKWKQAKHIKKICKLYDTCTTGYGKCDYWNSANEWCTKDYKGLRPNKWKKVLFTEKPTVKGVNKGN